MTRRRCGWIGCGVCLAAALGSGAGASVPPGRERPRHPLPSTRSAASVVERSPAATRPAATGPAAVKPVDLSTPRGAAAAYVNAIVGYPGAPPLRAVCVGDARALEQAESAVARNAAEYDLAAAMSDRFGEPARRAAHGRDAERARLLDLVARARMVREPQQTLLLEPQSGWMLSTRLAGGQWRAVLPKALEKDEHAKLLQWMRRQTEQTHALAADVRAGRYRSVDDVDLARRRKPPIDADASNVDPP